MTQNHVPFRYDYVGSFLRPEKLKVAREKFQNNEITQEELKITGIKQASTGIPFTFLSFNSHVQ